jgi:transposase InsO family protein
MASTSSRLTLRKSASELAYSSQSMELNDRLATSRKHRTLLNRSTTRTSWNCLHYQSVKHFAVYLSFLPEFLVRSDNEALRWWRTTEFAPGDIRSKWKSYLDPFRFEVEHLPGASNTIADAISRAPNTVMSSPTEPHHIRHLMQQQAASQVARADSTRASTSANTEQDCQTATPTPTDQPTCPVANVKASYGRDHALIISVLKRRNHVNEQTIAAGSVELKELFGQRKWLQVHNGLIYRQTGPTKLLYIPKKKRSEILESSHDLAHHSAAKMYAALKQRLWWPSMRSDIELYVATCDKCLRKRTVIKIPHAPLQLFRAASRFELVHLDILGGGSFPVTKAGHHYILVMVDHFTRYCVATPLRNQEAETVAHAFVTDWVWRFGAPMRVHSDQGRNFESTLFADMCQHLQIAKSRTLAYHPQGNGAVERVNRTLISLLRTIVCEKRALGTDTCHKLCLHTILHRTELLEFHRTSSYMVKKLVFLLSSFLAHIQTLLRSLSSPGASSDEWRLRAKLHELPLTAHNAWSRSTTTPT